MRFSDYQIVRAADSNELQIKVRTALADGWSPLGAPFYDGRNLLQAITLEAQHEDVVRQEATKQLAGLTAEGAPAALAVLQSVVGADQPATSQAEPASAATEAAPAPAPVAAPAPAAKTPTKAEKS